MRMSIFSLSLAKPFVHLAFYKRRLEFMSFDGYFMKGVPLQWFDLLSQLQNMSILFLCIAFSFLSSRIQGCHVVFVLPLDFFSSFSTSSFIWRLQVHAAALSSTVAFFNITLFSVLVSFYFYFSMSFYAKQKVFCFSWQNSLLKGCKLWACSILTTVAVVIPWLPQGTGYVLDFLVPWLVLL